MLIRNVMTQPLICCAPDDKVDAVARVMADHNCGELPVLDREKLVGVITDRDITCRVVAAGKTPNAVAVSEVMTRNVISIRETAKLESALDLMQKALVRRLPVIDDDNHVIGIVSQADLVAKAPTLKVVRAMRSVAKKTRGHAPTV